MRRATLLLASASPRRAELLRQLGVKFSCRPADVDETPLPGEAPRDYVERLARDKAETVFRRQDVATRIAVLAADTTVVTGDELLGKPTDVADGLAILKRLSGCDHRVYTAVCLRHLDGSDCTVVETEVRFAELSEDTCLAYLVRNGTRSRELHVAPRISIQSLVQRHS